MPEAFADDFQRNPVLQHQRRVGVAQVVQSDRRHARRELQPANGLRQRVRVNRLAIGARAQSRPQPRP